MTTTPNKYDSATCHAAISASGAYLDPVAEGGTLLSDTFTDAQCVITFADDNPATEAVEPATATVAFRGSSSRADWYGNLWFPLKSLPSPHRASVKAHSGFLRQYLSLHSHILKELEKRPEVKHVVLTGHSLGGALAVICAAMLPPPYTCDVVTFGSPRSGNQDLCDAAFHKVRTLVRVVHDRDVVPCIPPTMLGFSHICEPWVHLDTAGTIRHEEREWGVWRQCFLRMRGLVRRDLGVLDHRMSNYRRGIASADSTQTRACELTKLA